MDKRIYKNVKLGKGVEIEDSVVIGHPAQGMQDGELETVIGDGAFIRSGTIIYAGNRIGKNFRTGHNVVIRESNKIGDDISVGSFSCIEHHVEISNGVRIHSQAFIPEFSVLKDKCWIGPNVVLTNAPHPLCPKAKECLKGPVIGKRAKIGANSTILPDVRIGEDALVGAGSVVVRDVMPSSVVAGNPAKVIKKLKELTCKYKLIKAPYGTD